MKGISRFDYGHTHGWFVRVYGMGKTLKSKLFSDSKYGGRKKALVEAKKYRDEMHKLKPVQKYPLQIRNHKKNISGIVGVYHFRRLQSSGIHTDNIVGTYYRDGKQFQKSFAVALHGKEKALQKAIAFRNQGQARVTSAKLKYWEQLRKADLL